MKMAVRRLQFGVAVIKDKLILVGGRDGLRTLNTVRFYFNGLLLKYMTTLCSIRFCRLTVSICTP